MTQYFTFTVIAKMELEHTQGASKSQLKETKLRLELSRNLDKNRYLNRDLPTKEAIKPITNCLVQGLIANIKMAHSKEWWPEADHLRYIIEELQRGFVTNAEVGEGNF